MRDLSHEEIRELLGAYALDAVDDDERTVVDAHLPTCPHCSAEVSDHRDTASYLAHAGAVAPPGVWDKIASSLDDGPPGGAIGTIELFRPKWTTRVLGAAAVLVVAAGVAFVVGRLAANDPGSRGDATQAAIASAYADPAAKPVRLTSADGHRYVDVVLAPDGRGYLVRDNLPALPADRTYQLWGVVDAGDKVSLGVLGNSLRSVGFAGGGRVAALAITEEKAGGVVAPTSDPVVASRV